MSSYLILKCIGPYSLIRINFSSVYLPTSVSHGRNRRYVPPQKSIQIIIDILIYLILTCVLASQLSAGLIRARFLDVIPPESTICSTLRLSIAASSCSSKSPRRRVGTRYWPAWWTMIATPRRRRIDRTETAATAAWRASTSSPTLWLPSSSSSTCTSLSYWKTSARYFICVVAQR